MRRIALPCTAVALATALWLPSPAAAQTYYSVMPTFETSYSEFSAVAPGSSYTSWGIMAGQTVPGRWWAPHLWFQKYDLDTVCSPELDSCGNDGWALSVGPAIDFVRSPRVLAQLVTQVGLGSHSAGQFTGGSGVHLTIRAGVFQPQAFGRVQFVRGRSFMTAGVGLRFEWRTAPGPAF